MHLRRFCLIAIDQRVPEESTVRKLVRRLGPEVVEAITRLVLDKAQRETRFRGRAARVDSTVVEADIRYPSDAILALQGARALARVGKNIAGMLKDSTLRVRDRSRSVGKAVRAISRTLVRRTGEAKAQVLVLNEQAGRLIARSAREAQRLAAQATASARGRGAQAKLRAAAKLDELATRCRRISEQIDHRARGLKITDRLVSIADPDARPIGKGKLGKPTEFGYVAQTRDHREHQARRARDDPARQSRAGQPGREPAPGPNHGRAGPGSDQAARDRRRRRLPTRPDQGGAPRPHRRADPAIRPPRARLASHAQSAGRATAPGSRGASATPNAATACAARGSKAMTDAHLDRLGDPRLRPRHPHHPDPLKPFPTPTPPGNTHKPNPAAPMSARPFQSPELVFPRFGGHLSAGVERPR